MKRWKDNWDAVSPIFKFSTTVRKVIYTTNAIESLNSTYRKLNRQRSVFPSDTALLKALYLDTFEATKKWTTTIRDWAQVYGDTLVVCCRKMFDGFCLSDLTASFDDKWFSVEIRFPFTEKIIDFSF